MNGCGGGEEVSTVTVGRAATFLTPAALPPARPDPPPPRPAPMSLDGAGRESGFNSDEVKKSGSESILLRKLSPSSTGVHLPREMEEREAFKEMCMRKPVRIVGEV